MEEKNNVYSGNLNSLYSKHLKRVFDFVMAFFAIIVLSPILLFVSVAVLISSGRPIVFKQTRVGRFGHPFTIYKFRSMVKDASKIGPTSTGDNDCRITKVGNIIRKTSLDELPQLFNILKGDMSFIGYRPGVEGDYSQVDYDSGVFLVRPGLTGMAQVNGRSSLTPEKKRYYELEYVKKISFATDVKIFFKTILIVLKKVGTN